MLNNNTNIFFIIAMYILVLVVELFHFGSDINTIILLESFLCFSILLFMLSSTFQEIFVLGLHIVTFKYNYVYVVFNNLVNLNVNIYKIFINYFMFIFFVLVKIFVSNHVLIQKLKDLLKKEYSKIINLLKKEELLYLQNYVLILFN